MNHCRKECGSTAGIASEGRSQRYCAHCERAGRGQLARSTALYPRPGSREASRGGGLNALYCFAKSSDRKGETEKGEGDLLEVGNGTEFRALREPHLCALFGPNATARRREGKGEVGDN